MIDVMMHILAAIAGIFIGGAIVLWVLTREWMIPPFGPWR